MIYIYIIYIYIYTFSINIYLIIFNYLKNNSNIYNLDEHLQ